MSFYLPFLLRLPLYVSWYVWCYRAGLYISAHFLLFFPLSEFLDWIISSERGGERKKWHWCESVASICCLQHTSTARDQLGMCPATGHVPWPRILSCTGQHPTELHWPGLGWIIFNWPTFKSIDFSPVISSLLLSPWSKLLSFFHTSLLFNSKIFICSLFKVFCKYFEILCLLNHCHYLFFKTFIKAALKFWINILSGPS